MARARNIKPAIMDNEILAELEPLTRLLFVYLWMLADREGRLEDRPKRIAAQALAYDRTADVGAMLDNLQSAGFIVRYVAGGSSCIQILAFKDHQNPHVREAASELPAYDPATAKVVASTNLGSAEASPRSPDSGFRIPDPGLSDSSSPGSTPPPRKKPKPAKTQIPEDFEISERVRTWAGKNGFTMLEKHLDAFVRKCKAKAYENVSWDDAFMEAIREDWAKLRGRMQNGSAPPADHQSADDLETQVSIEKMGCDKGLGPWDCLKEQFPAYKARVLKAPNIQGFNLLQLGDMALKHQKAAA
jgi:hypothetical protein